jgi:hypothetical protein
MVTVLGDLSELGMHSSLRQGRILAYLWTAVILAIFVSAMFELGLFDASLSSQTICRTASGYLCQNATMGSSGKVSFSLGQAVGGTIYNVGIACAAKATLVGEPFAYGNAFTYVGSDGYMVNEPTGFSLLTGSSISIRNLTCFDANGHALTSNVAAGKYFPEVLWLNWTQQAGPPSALNPWLTTKFASVNIRAS